jgi:hypothetical protein
MRLRQSLAAEEERVDRIVTKKKKAGGVKPPERLGAKIRAG